MAWKKMQVRGPKARYACVEKFMAITLFYGPYTITKAMGSNSFDLKTPLFLGLHPVFNVDLLRPYFQPLLDTSKIVEQLKTT
jgi:hypothetical protein